MHGKHLALHWRPTGMIFFDFHNNPEVLFYGWGSNLLKVMDLVKSWAGISAQAVWPQSTLTLLWLL